MTSKTNTEKVVLDKATATKILTENDSDLLNQVRISVLAEMAEISTEIEKRVGDLVSKRTEIRSKFDTLVKTLHSLQKCQDVQPIRKPKDKKDENDLLAFLND